MKTSGGILVVGESAERRRRLVGVLRSVGALVAGDLPPGEVLRGLKELAPTLLLLDGATSAEAVLTVAAVRTQAGVPVQVAVCELGEGGGALARAVLLGDGVALTDLAGLVRLVREAPPSGTARLTGSWEEVDYSQAWEGFVGESAPMKRVKRLIADVAASDLTVLITGETGTGKGLAARSLHRLSHRAGAPFMKINCAALPETLLESELFGHEKGAFTGAHQAKPGRFELAHGGTIFLDEISEMSPTLQAKLLQVLEDRSFMRVGGKKEIEVDVRIIAATNRDLAEAMASGAFRSDLFYRLGEVNVAMPPLRERKEDIPLLVDYLGRLFAQQYRKTFGGLRPERLAQLLDYDWPGNVRELANYVKRAVVTGNDELIDSPAPPLGAGREPATLAASVIDSLGEGAGLKEIAREAAMRAEREAIRRALEEAKWNRTLAAKRLRVSYKTLLVKMKECGLGE